MFLVFVIVLPLHEDGVHRTTQLHVLDDLIISYVIKMLKNATF